MEAMVIATGLVLSPFLFVASANFRISFRSGWVSSPSQGYMQKGLMPVEMCLSGDSRRLQWQPDPAERS